MIKRLSPLLLVLAACGPCAPERNGVDAGPGDGSVDAGTDAGNDASVDAGIDSGIEGDAGAWIPPYPLPRPGTKIQLIPDGGANTMLDVRPNGFAAYSWGYALGAAIFQGYGGGAYARDYSPGGAFVIAGVGGHGAGGIYGGLIFDFTDGRWVAAPNSNGKVEQPDDPDSNIGSVVVDTATGQMLQPAGLLGELPAPSHGYLQHIAPPKSVTGSARGFLLKPVLAAYGTTGRDSHKSYKFDLDTHRWTFASSNDATVLTSNPYTDSHTAYDPAARRIYLTSPMARGDDALLFLEPDGSTEGWRWATVSCPNMPRAGVRMDSIFVDARRHLLVFTKSNSTGRSWHAVDLTNIAAGVTTLNVGGDVLPEYHDVRWAEYPLEDGGDGAFYSYNGAGPAWTGPWTDNASPVNHKATAQALWKLTPPSTDPLTGTWVISRTPIAPGDGSGGITATWQGEYGDRPTWNGGFQYVPPLRAFAWVPRIDSPVELIKP